MTTLVKQSCVPCGQGSSSLAEEESRTLRAQVPNWHIIHEDNRSKLQRYYDFPDFKGALAFTQQVGNIAETEGHHPVLTTEWGKVTVTWWTHSVDGLHQNDFVMAAKTDKAYMSEV